MKAELEKAARKSLAEQTNTYDLTKEEINTLVSVGIIPKNTPLPQISFFAKACKERGLSPVLQQIHLIRRRVNGEARYTHQTSIDGYRSIAGRTGLYAGNDDYLFNEGVTEYQMLKSGREQPLTATATVFKMIGGVRCPFTATARWVEYYPGDRLGFMWKKMPFLMLGKCAEALALRKAFPDQLGKLYVDEEMENIQPERVIQLKRVAEEKEKTEETTPVSIETVEKEKPKAETKPKTDEIKPEKLNAEDYIRIIESYKTLNQLHAFKEKNSPIIKVMTKAEKNKIVRCYNKKEKEISDKLVNKS